MDKNTNIKKLIEKDIRADSFKKSIRFINYEIVLGDIVEFGVYSGRSLACFSYFNDLYHKEENEHNSNFSIKRKIYGFDSFEGLNNGDGHPRWIKDLFKNNHSYHPTIKIGEQITPKKIEIFFKKMKLKKPIIIKCFYNNLKIDFIKKISLCHIDCDLYFSCKQALNLIKNKLQNGSIILFDNWFNNKGDENKGEQKACMEFLIKNKKISLIEFDRYATFCKSFIVRIKK